MFVTLNKTLQYINIRIAYKLMIPVITDIHVGRAVVQAGVLISV